MAKVGNVCKNGRVNTLPHNILTVDHFHSVLQARNLKKNRDYGYMKMSMNDTFNRA
jgi:hypothetical protein